MATSSVKYLPANRTSPQAHTLPTSQIPTVAEQRIMNCALKALGIPLSAKNPHKVLIPEGCTLDTAFNPRQGSTGIVIKYTTPKGEERILKIGFEGNLCTDTLKKEVEATRKANDYFSKHTVSGVSDAQKLQFPLHPEGVASRTAISFPYAGKDLLAITETMRTTKSPASLQIFFNTLKGSLVIAERSEEHNFFHRDVKPDNIVVDKEGGIRWIDWSSSIHYTPDYVTGRWYRSPGILSEERKDMGIFLFSSACTLFQLVTGTPLFYSSFYQEDKDRFNRMLIHLTNVTKLFPLTNAFVESVPKNDQEKYFVCHQEKGKECKYALQTPAHLASYEMSLFKTWEDVKTALNKVKFDIEDDRLKEFPNLFESFLRKCLDYTKPPSLEEVSKDPLVTMIENVINDSKKEFVAI